MTRLPLTLLRATVLLCVLTAATSCAPKKPNRSGPPPVEYLTHTISFPGETLTLISSWYTGYSQNWRAIEQHNPGLDVSRMQLGETVRIPMDMVVRPQPFTRDYIESAWAKKRGGELGAGETPELVVVDPRMLETEPPVNAAAETESAAVIESDAAPKPEAVQPAADTAARQADEPAAREKSRDQLLQELLKEY